MTAAAEWEAWAPPLAPPAAGGLPYSEAERIAAAWWDEDPHMCAALQWESWAASLPPALPVAQVNTGVQSVTYGRAIPGGALGEALSRASWHRSLAASGGTVPLRADRGAGYRRYQGRIPEAEIPEAGLPAAGYRGRATGAQYRGRTGQPLRAAHGGRA